MLYFLAPFGFAVGYLVRDGIPATGHTQVARSLAAIICGASILCYHLDFLLAISVALITLLSFFTDMKHAEGQNAKTIEDAEFLLLSGVTSVLPYAIACIVTGNYLISSLVTLAGLLKPAIWFIAWRVTSYYPTRFAAATFGFIIGTALIIGGVHG